MAGEMDKVKGKIKDAIGGMTDDHDLQGEGKVDKAAGKTQATYGDAKEKVKSAVDKA